MTLDEWLSGGARPVDPRGIALMSGANELWHVTEEAVQQGWFDEETGESWLIDVFECGTAVTWCRDA